MFGGVTYGGQGWHGQPKGGHEFPSGKVFLPENGCHIVVPWKKSFLWIGDSIWLRHVWWGHLWRARVAWAALRGARAPFLMSMSFNRWISPCNGPQKWFQLISSFPIIYDNRGPFGCHSRASEGIDRALIQGVCPPATIFASHSNDINFQFLNFYFKNKCIL